MNSLNFLAAHAYQKRMKAFAISLALLLVSMTATAQTKLYGEIADMDKKLFDAFNARDVETFATMFDTTLEFYHDRGGLTGYEQTIRQFKENAAKPSTLRRDLVPGTLEVHPIPNYGAIQIGTHRFCHEENGKQDCGVFKFVHVWQKKDGVWKITRVVSYDH